MNILPSLWNVYAQHLAGYQVFSPAGRPWRSEGALLDSALRNLERFAFVGIVEDMQASLDAMHQRLAIGRYNGDVRDNVTSSLHIIDPLSYNPPTDIVVDDEACERLHELTRLDRIIYDTVLRHRAMPPRTYTLQCGSGGRLIDVGGVDWVETMCPDDTLLYGPYATLGTGQYRVSFTADLNAALSAGSLLLEVATNKGATVRTRQTFAVRSSPDPQTLTLDFRLERPAGDVEFRAFSRAGGEVIVKPQVIVERL